MRWISAEPAFTPYYALTERDRGHLTYLAKVDIAEDRERLPDGVPVEVDLGSGGGLDVFIAAQKVAPGGSAIGVDMTPEMVRRAEDAAREIEEEA